jgi:hypothetical protein
LGALLLQQLTELEVEALPGALVRPSRLTFPYWLRWDCLFR